MQSTDTVKANLRLIYNRRYQATYALCIYYAGLVLQHFRMRQEGNTYWENRTNLAKDLVFSQPFMEEGGNVMGFLLAHTVHYGVYLELANNRQNEALRPIINEYLPKFKADLERLYA